MKIDLRGNAVAAVLEQIAVGGSFLVFYGVLIREVGPDLVGVLSLVLILSSVGTMANAGFGSAAARFVPLFEGRGDRSSTLACIETTLLCTVALYAVLLAVAYVPFQSLIAAQAGARHAGLVAELMVPAAAYVMLMGAGSATSLALTGLQRSDMRTWANVAGACVMMLVLFWGAPRHGLVAGMWALAAQAGTAVAVTWVQLRRVLPDLNPVPMRLDAGMARRMLGLGLNLQVQSLLVAAIDPVARLLIGHYGGLADVTWFSMASRFVFQVRALVFAASQPLLSAFSYLGEADPEARSALYARVTAIVAFSSLLALSAAAGAAPFVGEAWIGSRQDAFVVHAALLAAGWLANTMALSAYFLAYASGRMTWNLVAHVVLLLGTMAAGALLGMLWGAVGVTGGMALALAASGLVMAIGNGRLALPPRPRVADHLVLGVSVVLAVPAAVAIYGLARGHAPALVAGVASGLAWLLVVSPAALTHPVGRLALDAARGRLSPKVASPGP